MFGEIYQSQLSKITEVEEVSSLLYFICLLELLGLLLSLICLAVILRLPRKKDVFHTNLNICLNYYYIIDVIMAFIRLIYLYKQFTDNVDPFWKHVFCEARVVFIVTTLGGMTVILLERGCATYYLGRYDKKRRLHIPVICLLIPNLLLFSSYPYWINTDNIVYSGVIALIVTTVAFSSYIWLVAYNTKRLRTMYEGLTKYSLSNRYQIDENGRVFQIMRSAFFVVSLHFALIPMSIAGSHFVSSHLSKELLRQTSELLLSTLPIPTILCFIVNTKEWRYEVLRFFCREKTIAERIPIQPRQGDAYFDHLAKLWNISVEPETASSGAVY